jgi:hypothetical protein
MNYWTSGSSEGLFCDIESVFSWCSIDQMVESYAVENTLQGIDQANVSTLASCLVLSLSTTTATLDRADCAAQKPFLCQVKFSMPTWHCKRMRIIYQA